MIQNEIQGSLSLLDDRGFPQNFGWSKHAQFFYNPSLSYQSRQGITESDRYIVFSPTHMVTFEIRDDGWLGYLGISVISLRDKKRTTQIFNTFMPLGSFEMPNCSTTGNVRWRKRKKKHLDFICMESGARIIKTDIDKFGHHRSFRGALVLMDSCTSGKEETSEPLVTNQPWRNEKNAFRYTRCSPWHYVEGVIQFGSTEIIFTRGNGWGIFDWNRCARPKADIRYWAAACGYSDGMQMSFCVGYSQADSSLGTENAFFIDGKLHKLDQVTFHIPTSNWLSPWRFTSNDNRLEMTFNPHQERIDRRRLLFFNSTRRQVCGFFSGRVHLDDQTVIEFHNLTGFAERSKSRL